MRCSTFMTRPYATVRQAIDLSILRAATDRRICVQYMDCSPSHRRKKASHSRRARIGLTFSQMLALSIRTERKWLGRGGGLLRRPPLPGTPCALHDLLFALPPPPPPPPGDSDPRPLLSEMYPSLFGFLAAAMVTIANASIEHPDASSCSSAVI